PNGVALRPEIFAFIIEASRLTVDHYAQRYAVDASTDAAVVQRCTSINGHAVRLRRVTDNVRPGVHHVTQQHALVKARAPNQEIFGRPFAALVLPPGFAQPFAIGFEPAGGQHTGARLDALAVAQARCDETPIVQFDLIDR